jgi:hypothetical protein
MEEPACHCYGPFILLSDDFGAFPIRSLKSNSRKDAERKVERLRCFISTIQRPEHALSSTDQCAFGGAPAIVRHRQFGFGTGPIKAKWLYHWGFRR